MQRIDQSILRSELLEELNSRSCNRIRRNAGHCAEQQGSGLALENLLVQLGGVLILKREVSRNHSEQDYTAAPNIAERRNLVEHMKKLEERYN